MWAYLPVGPLERQLRKGNQGGFWEEVPKNPQERVVAFLWWDILGKPLLITYIGCMVCSKRLHFLKYFLPTCGPRQSEARNWRQVALIPRSFSRITTRAPPAPTFEDRGWKRLQ